MSNILCPAPLSHCLAWRRRAKLKRQNMQQSAQFGKSSKTLRHVDIILIGMFWRCTPSLPMKSWVHFFSLFRHCSSWGAVPFYDCPIQGCPLRVIGMASDPMKISSNSFISHSLTRRPRSFTNLGNKVSPNFRREATCFWNLLWKCPEIWPKIPEIQPEIPAISNIPVTREIRPKISEIWLGNLEIRRQIPGMWPEILLIRPEIG